MNLCDAYIRSRNGVPREAEITDIFAWEIRFGLYALQLTLTGSTGVRTVLSRISWIDPSRVPAQCVYNRLCYVVRINIVYGNEIYSSRSSATVSLSSNEIR